MASLGSKVLQTRSVELAMVHKMRTRVLSSFVAPEAMAPVRIGDLEDIGTIVCDEDEIVEQQVVSGIAYAKDEAKVTILKVEDKPGVAARIFGPLAEANINVDMIVQNVTADGKNTDMTFTVQAAELARALEVLKSAKKDIGYFDVKSLGRRGESVGHWRWHAQPCRRGRADVQGPVRKRHQHSGNLDFRDQDQRVDRCRVCRVGGAHAALALRSRRGMKTSARSSV